MSDILQNMHYLKTGVFVGTKKELVNALDGKDRQVLETALAYGRGEKIPFEHAFELLFTWCGKALAETSSDI